MVKVFDQIKNHYNELSITARTSMIYMCCSILQKGVSFFAVPIYTRLVPTDQYGIYALYQSWFLLISIFSTLSMWNYFFNNGMIKYDNRKDEFTSALIGLSGVTTICFFSIVFIFSEIMIKFSKLSMYLLILMFIELLLRPAFEYWYARQRFEYNIKKYAAVSILITLLQPVFCIILVLIVKQKAISYTGAALISGKVFSMIIVYVVIFIYLIKESNTLYDKEIWCYALKFNLPLIPHFLAGVVLQQSDRIMISNMCGTIEAGIYSVAYNFGAIMLFVNEALINVVVPWSYKKLKKKDYGGFTGVAIIILTIIAIPNIIISICAPEAISIIAPREYKKAIYVIPPVAISSVFMCLFNLYANIEYYFEETKLVAIASSSSAFINIFLNYVFINKYGFIAAGYTTVVCYLLYALCHMVFMKHVLYKQHIVQKIYNNSILWLFCFVSFFISVASIGLYKLPFIRYALLFVILVICWFQRNRVVNFYKTIKNFD